MIYLESRTGRIWQRIFGGFKKGRIMLYTQIEGLNILCSVSEVELTTEYSYMGEL